MTYCYINLADTDYTAETNHKILSQDERYAKTNQMLAIYQQYADYKKFKSVWPIYQEEFVAEHNDIIAYYDNNDLVAWSMMYRINNRAVEALQFAWDYRNPKLKLGIASMKTECAIYKELGYELIILGEAHEYKKQIDGFTVFPSNNLGVN